MIRKADRNQKSICLFIVIKRRKQISPTGKAQWQFSTIQSILSNEKYKGDTIINKTYITDCISKKVRVNNGERPKYYVENSHPAIIDSATFGRVQEELARRSGKRKVRQKAKTEQGKYSSKYAMTELLVCGECKTPYRRCTWTAGGKKKIVWRCINRLDYGKKYCHNSPTIEESISFPTNICGSSRKKKMIFSPPLTRVTPLNRNLYFLIQSSLCSGSVCNRSVTMS